MNPISEEKLNKWQGIIEEKRQSNLSLKEFCKGKNITPSQFYYYHAIINGNKKNQVKKINQKNIKSIQLINSHAKENSVIRIILPNNMQCVLPSDMNSQEIRSILEIMLSC